MILRSDIQRNYQTIPESQSNNSTEVKVTKVYRSFFNERSCRSLCNGNVIQFGDQVELEGKKKTEL